jgi:hypothetical protein
LDLQWHAGHDEFETASDQLRAHRLAWLGGLVLLVTAALAVRQGHRGGMLSALLVGTTGSAGAAVCHFYRDGAAERRLESEPRILLEHTSDCGRG